jgi:hypothetical protein
MLTSNQDITNTCRLRTVTHQTVRNGLIIVKIHQYSRLWAKSNDTVENTEIVVNPTSSTVIPPLFQEINPTDMNKALNHTEIVAYAQRFASMVCSQFYRQNTVINGKQIVELTENKQINFFVLKALFFRWQDEMNNLRSPYFDYTNAEVNKTLTALMNLLSQNIAVARKDFEPLLVEAIKDSIVLALSPTAYYQVMFSQYNEAIHVPNQLKALAKYIKLYKPFYDRLLAYLEREANPTLSVQRATALLEQTAKEVATADESKELFAYFAKLLPARPENFFVKEEEVVLNVTTHKQVEETTNFFDTILTQEPVLTPKEEPVLQKPVYEPVIVKAEPVPVLKTEKPEVFSFNQQFQQQQTSSPQPTTLHAQVTQETTENEDDSTSLNDMVAKNQKLASLRESIPLNKKYAFVNVLFGGDNNEFDSAVTMIDQCNDYHKAIMLIKEKYFRRYAWDLEKEEVKEFYELVSRKF